MTSSDLGQVIFNLNCMFHHFIICGATYQITTAAAADRAVSVERKKAKEKAILLEQQKAQRRAGGRGSGRGTAVLPRAYVEGEHQMEEEDGDAEDPDALKNSKDEKRRRRRDREEGERRSKPKSRRSRGAREEQEGEEEEGGPEEDYVVVEEEEEEAVAALPAKLTNLNPK